MKRFLHWGVAVPMLAAALCLTACGGDDDKDPNGNGGGSVPDPEGTVTVQMRNRDSGHTEVFMYEGQGGGWFYIDAANNFQGSADMEFVSVGKVKGLGNIRNCPEKGWSNGVSVTPGCGYILRYVNRDYMRIYVVDYIVSTGGGIIGATIKYQRGFIPENLPTTE